MSLFRTLFRGVARLCRLNLVAAFCVASGAAFAQQPYQVLDHWLIGGTGGWDYLIADSAAHLLYITHGPRVEVIDSQTGKSVAAITGLKATHGVALDGDGKFGYVSDSGTNQVAVFDRKTFATVTTVAAGTGEDAIVFEPSTKTVWVFNGRSKDVAVIDAATNQVIATIPLPGKPEFAVADGSGSVYDAIEDQNEIVRLDAKSKKLVATWKLTDCESPSGMAMDRAGRRLFPVCDGKKMAVVDADSGKQLATAEIGEGPDAASYSVSQRLAFSSNGQSGTLSVIDAVNGYKTIETLPTEARARTMAYDDLADRVYLVTAKFGPAPAATAENPRPRPTVLPDTFEIVVVGRE
jgi:YVTN family beta-propeller protein